MIKGNFTLSLYEVNEHADNMQEYITSRIREKHPNGEIKEMKVQGTDWGIDVEYKVEKVK